MFFAYSSVTSICIALPLGLVAFSDYRPDSSISRFCNFDDGRSDIGSDTSFARQRRKPYQPGATPQDLEPRIARNAGCDCYRAGGVADHVHLAVRLLRTSTIAYLVQELKTKSSKWLKTQSPLLADFAWERGNGAFSVGPADLGALQAYIEAQEEHHRTRSFQEEPLPGALPQAGMATRLWRLVGYASNGRNLRCCSSYCSMRPVRMS